MTLDACMGIPTFWGVKLISFGVATHTLKADVFRRVLK